MAGQQRKCANCRFFSDAGMPGNGWCTHPKRQLNSGVKLLVRAGELACRNTWGGDLFQSRLDDDSTPVAAADLPGSDRDDEVTSVTIPSHRPAPAEDRVVRDRPAAHRRDPEEANDAAHRDQEERARIMARGNRDALALARQRYSTRRQPVAQDDVVADDNDGESADRVVTRQARFSDRDFGAGMPPLRTAPVPREEVAEHAGTPADRFDTVPAIDPDFDMPGQRHRPEPAAAAQPEPMSIPDPEPAVEEPMTEDEQLTAYEHVLQRARRIRATKQERTRPLRHADILASRPGVAAGPFDGRYEPVDQVVSDEWDDEPIDAAPLAAEAYEDDDDAPAWDAGEDQVAIEPWLDEADSADAWQVESLSAASFDADADWDDAADEETWLDDDAGERYDPEPRRSGWLGRLGLRRRSPELADDPAVVTRHASATPEWDDDAPEGDPDWIADEPVPAPSWPAAQDDLPAWRERARREVYADELPAWREPVHAEDLPAAAPVPPPVPASERAGGSWDIASMPVRTAAPPRSRQRLTAELPDLDEMLFDEDDDLPMRAEPAARDHREPARPSGAPSARDSFFRASRYPRQEASPAFADGAGADTLDQTAFLPDLEGDRLDLRDVVARGGELIDRRIEVAPDVPRQCRTCRSFRSTDGGTRGWCTNEWAFTHRRMVNDDDLACVSAIGCWWLPADHLRLDLDDDTEDVRTPRMDDLIGVRRPATRRVVGE